VESAPLRQCWSRFILFSRGILVDCKSGLRVGSFGTPMASNWLPCWGPLRALKGAAVLERELVGCGNWDEVERLGRKQKWSPQTARSTR
jgi:hypothetical protein